MSQILFWLCGAMIVAGIGAAFVGYCCARVAGQADDLAERIRWNMQHPEGK